MNAADTNASSAIADCTPLTVVSRSRTTAEIDTFISEVSTTSTNIAMDSRIANRRFIGACHRDRGRRCVAGHRWIPGARHGTGPTAVDRGDQRGSIDGSPCARSRFSHAEEPGVGHGAD